MSAMQVVPGGGANPNNLQLGDIIGLWDVARNKIIGLSTLSLYYRQAKDKELKDLVKDGVDFILVKHMNKVQELLKDRGYDFPMKENWKMKFDEDAPFAVPNTMINDEEIAMSLREIIRLTLTLEAEGLKNATDEGVRKLLAEILDDDNRGYTAVLALQRKKKWEDFPPVLLPH